MQYYTIAALVVVVLALPLHSANAHSDGLSADICDTFGVYHGERLEDSSKNVYLTFFGENGEPQECFVPQRNYFVKLNSSSLIKGFLLEASGGARLPSKNANLPTDVTQGPCPRGKVNSLSHTQRRTERSEELYFPITARRSTQPLQFRYTVVFSLTSYLANKTLEIPCCETLNVGVHTETVPQPTAVSGSGTVSSETSKLESGSGTVEGPTNSPFSTLPPLGTPVVRICGRTVKNTYKSVNRTVDGVRYNCTINRPLKKTICEASCEIEGQDLQCQVYKHIPRRKGYTCVPYTDCDQANINVSRFTHRVTLEEIVTTGCQCFTEDTSSSSTSDNN